MKRNFAKLTSAFFILTQLTTSFTISANAAEPGLTVLPWNGAKSAVSLTFDDGYTSHTDTVIPALNKLNMKATFFIFPKLWNDSDWSSVVSQGHEIGNHSVKHLDPSNFTETQAYDETVGAQKQLEEKYKTKIVSYDYPYTNAAAILQKYLKDTHVAARGGWGFSYYMEASSTPDWMNIPSQATTSAQSFASNYKSWVDTTLSKNAWSVFMIHDVGGSDLPLNEFNLLINYLDSNKSNIWVAPFGTVSGYWRAQKIFEGLAPAATSSGKTYSWEVPAFFPKGLNLKVKLDNGTGYQLVQSGKALVPDSNGVYTISFDAKTLEMTNNLPTIKLGDVNGDDSIDSLDFSLMKSYLIGKIAEFPVESGLKAADVNGDGEINSIDLALMKQYLLGKIIAFPVQ